MNTKPQRPTANENALSSLNAAINTLDLARETASANSAKDALSSASVLLTTIRDSAIDGVDCIELGLTCADVCQTLDRGISARGEDQPSETTLEAINQLKTAIGAIQKHVVKRGKRNVISRRFHARDDEKAVATWKSELGRIRSIFANELAASAGARETRRASSDACTVPPDVINTGNIAPIIRRETPVKEHEDADDENRSAYASVPEEAPPPPLRTTPGTAADVRHDVAKTRTIVSEVRRDVVDTQTMVTEIHQNLLKFREDGDRQKQPVSRPVEIHGLHTVLPGGSISVLVHWSIRIFYQAPDGIILRAEYNGQWTHFRHQDITNAVLFTPLASVTWRAEKEVRVYYLDHKCILQEYRYSEEIGWFAGDIGGMNVRASPNTQLGATCFYDEGHVHILLYYQEPGSQDITEMSWYDGIWRAGRRLLITGALDGTSIAAAALNWDGGISIRVHYQAEDLSLRDYCYDSGREWHPGEWNPGKIPGRNPIHVVAYEFDGNLEVHAFWRNDQGEVDTSKHTGSWGPFLVEERFDAANTHIEQAKRCAPDNISSAQVMELQARILCSEGRFIEANSRLADVYQELGHPEVAKLLRMLPTLLECFSDKSDPNDPDQEPGDATSPVNDQVHSPDHNSD